jgi:hypothetical protein
VADEPRLPYPRFGAAVPVVYSQNPTVLDIPGPRDVAVRMYCAWQQSKVVDATLKAEFQKACDVTLRMVLTLEQVFQDQDTGFFIYNDLKRGVARHFVTDIEPCPEDPSFSFASSPFRVSFVRLLRTSNPTSASRDLPLALCRNLLRPTSSLFSRTLISVLFMPNASRFVGFEGFYTPAF